MLHITGGFFEFSPRRKKHSRKTANYNSFFVFNFMPFLHNHCVYV